MCGKLLKSRLIIGLLCFLIILSCSVGSVQAYNMSASHKVNDKDVNVEEVKAKLWKTIRSWGFSEEATAGIMGNIEAECTYNPTKVEDDISWSSFSKGSCGIGINQWTSPGRQQGLFDLCDARGTQWTDLDTQLEWLKKEMDGETGESTWWNYAKNCKSYEEYKKLTDIQVAVDVFCWGFERPNAAYAHLDRRRNSAKDAFKQFTGTSGDVADSNSSESKKDIQAQLVVQEWDLEGMPEQSGILSDCNVTPLPEYDNLDNSEKYSLNVVKENLLLNKEIKIYDLIRISVVFIGLLLIIYAVFLMVAYLFDKTNNIVEISLLSVITLGVIKTIDEDSKGQKGYMSCSKLVKSSILCMVVGFFIASGGVFAWVLKFYNMIKGVF